jgi:gamma-glutamyltranspeptidase/glutathione hydrolase
MLREFGTWRLADVLEPAIGYTEHGFPLVPRIPTAIENVEELFRDEWTSSAEIYLRDGVPQPGQLLRNSTLAAMYQRIVRESRSGTREEEIERARELWYEGFVAEAIEGFMGSEVIDSTGERHAGLLTGEDMARWRATLEQPLSREYRGNTVFKTGPWGQGPVFLQQLALLDGFRLGELEPGSESEFIHTVVECAKLAFADREAWYGDPNFVDVPLDRLLSAEYADERRRLVVDNASDELRPGLEGARLPAPVEGLRTVGVGEPTRASDTCHVDVVDRDGNLVSATPSGGWLHSAPVVPGLGFPLGTRGQMFWLEEGLPGSLVPGKRPRTTLSPSLAFRSGDPYMAFGTPGGDQQDQWSLVFFLHHVDFAQDLQAAIDAPSFHTNHFPSSFYPRDAHPREVEVEGRFSEQTIDELGERGHDVVVTGDWSLGRVSAAARENGLLKAAANARGMQGYAVGR